jgi:hypothetical protein
MRYDSRRASRSLRDIGVLFNQSYSRTQRSALVSSLTVLLDSLAGSIDTELHHGDIVSDNWVPPFCKK